MLNQSRFNKKERIEEMKTQKSNKPVTQEEINRVLAALDAAELTRLAREKKQASLQPMIAEYGQMETRLVELRKSIREVNPEWNPPTLADRILAFIQSKGKATAEEVVKEFGGSATPFLIKNILKKKTDTLWTSKDGKFSAMAKI
jgi:hypothetical protein